MKKILISFLFIIALQTSTFALTETQNRLIQLNTEYNQSSKEALERKLIALKFYLEYDWQGLRIKGHTGAIDYDHTVAIVILPKDTIVSQWQTKNAQKGNYFSIIGTKAESLGINPIGRTVKYFRLKQDTVVLKSIALAVVDTWTNPNQPYLTDGGGIQYFTGSPELFEEISYSN